MNDDRRRAIELKPLKKAAALQQLRALNEALRLYSEDVQALRGDLCDKTEKPQGVVKDDERGSRGGCGSSK